MASVNTLIAIFVGIFLFGSSFVQAEGDCIEGKYHKPAPGREQGFPICQEFSNNTCCTKDFTIKLKASRTEQLYNHSWDLCAPLSKPCEKFWLQQECFYQCSPHVYKWSHPDGKLKDAIHGVPICSSVCNNWFDACKDDQICVQDVLNDYVFLANGSNRCPAKNQCKTYRDMFGNGEGLCNKMWNTSYVYTQENADQSNCMVLSFNGTNPNGRVQKPTSPSPTQAGPTAFASVVRGSMLFMMLVLIVSSALLF